MRMLDIDVVVFVGARVGNDVYTGVAVDVYDYMDFDVDGVAR